MIIVLVTLALLEGALRLGYSYTPPAFRLHLMESLPPEDLPAYAGDMGWELREFYSQLEPARALSNITDLTTDGDLYNLTCASPPEDAAPNPLTTSADEFGFRLDQPYPLWRNNPDVIVLGDSLGASGMIGNPFWHGISERPWGLNVSGSGTQEQASILRTILDTREVAPRVIVVQFFEGNDIYDAYAYPAVAADHTVPTPPTAPSALERLYTVQLAYFLLSRITPPELEQLPEEATRTFDMWVDNPPQSDTPTTMYTGGKLWGWAIDTRDGMANGTGITQVRLHAGETCDGALLASDPQQDIYTRYRPDILRAFNLPDELKFSGFRMLLETEPGQQTISICAESETGEVIQQTRQVNVLPCPFPLKTTNDEDIVFYPHYLGMATLNAVTISNSTGYANSQAALLDIQAMADEIGAELVLLYVPSKIHAYINVMDDAELLRMGDIFRAYGTLTDNPSTEYGDLTELTTQDALERLRENVAEQRRAIRALALVNNIPFVDTTPALQASAAQGEMPFHTADTHVNDVGGAVIREVLREALIPYLDTP